MRYWLMKSEPEVFSIRELKQQKRTLWEGVRNYQARNFMQQDMHVGDSVLFYHSNSEPPGIAGVAKVCHLAKPDPTQFDKKSEYYDPKASVQNPRWFAVGVEFQEEFPTLITLAQMRQNPELSDMLVLRRGQRLSIQPVKEFEFHHLMQMARQ